MESALTDNFGRILPRKAKNVIKRLFNLKPVREVIDKTGLLKVQVYNFLMYRDIEIFGNIAIETHSICNRRCKNCPVTFYPRKKLEMPETIFHRIIDQLAERNYKGAIGLHWYNEPLLDKRLSHFISYADNKCPESWIYFASNGDLLDIKTFRMLIKSGLSHITITQYDRDLRLNLRTLIDNLNETEKKYITIFKFGEYICNRGGSLRELQLFKPQDLKCSRPDIQMVVNAEGKVILCCNDYFGEEIMGDAVNENVFDIWKKERFMKIRTELRRGNRKNIDICSKCDFVFEKYALPRKRTQ